MSWPLFADDSMIGMQLDIAYWGNPWLLPLNLFPIPERQGTSRFLSDIARRAQYKRVLRFADCSESTLQQMLSHCFAVIRAASMAGLGPEQALLYWRMCHKSERGLRMEGQSTTIASKILQVVRAHPGCGLDDLVERLSDVQWSDVFVEVDRLSRAGELRITKPNSGFLVMLHAV